MSPEVLFCPGRMAAKPGMKIGLRMPPAHPRIASALLALATAVFPSVSFVKAQQRSLDSYAITNARIVTVSGPVIEKGTVVIRDGLIVAVGDRVPTPADATIIDGSGLTVYPGLIDANTNLGLPEPAPSPSPGGAPGSGFAVLLRQTSAPASGGPNST